MTAVQYVDYRMAGIYKKSDGAPREVVIYSEEDADPKIYIYSYPPDGMTVDEWIKPMEKHFNEYYDKKLGGNKQNEFSSPENTTT